MKPRQKRRVCSMCHLIAKVLEDFRKQLVEPQEMWSPFPLFSGPGIISWLLCVLLWLDPPEVLQQPDHFLLESQPENVRESVETLGTG